MQKKILEFCLSPDLGGLELFVVGCYGFFSQKTTCYLMVQADKKLDRHIEDEKFYLKRSKFFPFIPARKLAHFIDEQDIDIIHFHWTRDIATVILAKVLSKKKPQVVQSRHMTMTRFKNDMYHKWLYKNIDLIHAVTYQVKEQLERFIPKEVRPKLSVVYPGVKSVVRNEKRVEELKKQYGLEGAFVVGIFGRIEENKGQWMVVEALAKLDCSDIKLIVVGNAMDDRYLQYLQQKVNDLGLTHKVVFTGFTKEVNEYMQLCDVTVLATPHETFGLVVVESMANKTPVIAVNSGGPIEIIEDQVDGLLFYRDVQHLADKIQLVYDDKELLSKLGENSVKKIQKKFSWERQLERLLEVIDEA